MHAPPPTKTKTKMREHSLDGGADLKLKWTTNIRKTYRVSHRSAQTLAQVQKTVF